MVYVKNNTEETRTIIVKKNGDYMKWCLEGGEAVNAGPFVDGVEIFIEKN